jgi:hypothetical protein
MGSEKNYSEANAQAYKKYADKGLSLSEIVVAYRKDSLKGAFISLLFMLPCPILMSISYDFHNKNGELSVEQIFPALILLILCAISGMIFLNFFIFHFLPHLFYILNPKGMAKRDKNDYDRMIASKNSYISRSKGDYPSASKLSHITSLVIDDTVDLSIASDYYASEIIQGLNRICDLCDYSNKLPISLAYSSGVEIFNKCEYTMRGILGKYDITYPSASVNAADLPSIKLPKLPSYRFIDRPGTETGVGVSGLYGSVFSLVGTVASAKKRSDQKYEMEKQNRVNNFVLIYNLLVDQVLG